MRSSVKAQWSRILKDSPVNGTSAPKEDNTTAKVIEY